MPRACDIGKKNKMDPALRRWILSFAAAFGLIGLICGFYLGFGFVTGDAALKAPLMEKFFLNTFIAISLAAAGMIFGAFVGSTIFRFIGKPKKSGEV